MNVPTVEPYAIDVSGSKEIRNAQEMWKWDMGPHIYIQIYSNRIVKNVPHPFHGLGRLDIRNDLQYEICVS